MFYFICFKNLQSFKMIIIIQCKNDKMNSFIKKKGGNRFNYKKK